MEKTNFKDKLFYALFTAKLIVVGWSLFMWMTKGYNFAQFKEILFIIVPLFSVNLSIAFQYYFKKKPVNSETEESIIPQPVKVITMILLAIYCLYMVGVLAQVPGEEEAFKNMKEMLGWSEILFGGYVGIVVKNVFD